MDKLKNLSNFTAAFLLGLLIFAVFIPINLIAERLKIQWDMTPNQLYSLTEVSQKTLSELQNDIEIYTLLDMDAVTSDVGAKPLAVMLEQFSEYPQISIINADPNTPEGIALIEQLNIDYNIRLNSGDFLVRSGSVIKKVAGGNMFKAEQGIDGDGKTYFKITAFSGENALTGTVKYVDKFASTNRRPMVYFLSGHDEKMNYANLITTMSEAGYKSSSLNLGASKEIPDDAQLIICSAPKTDISAAERNLLSEYIDKGGSVLFMLPPNEEKFDYTNISVILGKFAIAMRYDVVEDSSVMVEDDPRVFLANFSPVGTYGVESNITSALIGSELVPVASNSRSFFDLARTEVDISLGSSTHSSEYATSVPMGGANPDPREETSLFYLSMTACNKVLNNAKLFVIGDADFADDVNLNQENPNALSVGNYYLFLTAVSWLCDSEIDLSIPDKIKEYDRMDLGNSSENAQKVMALFIALPILIAGAGVLVWLKRNKDDKIGVKV
jgi:ABC-2 type transport system permease protein